MGNQKNRLTATKPLNHLGRLFGNWSQSPPQAPRNLGKVRPGRAGAPIVILAGLQGRRVSGYRVGGFLATLDHCRVGRTAATLDHAWQRIKPAIIRPQGRPGQDRRLAIPLATL
jgi:hypothetical protein